MVFAEQSVQLIETSNEPLPDSLDEILARRTFAEFFAGIGLVRMGLEQAGWNFSYANDNDPKKKEMYEGQFGPEGDRYDTADVRRINADTIPTVTLATASFPCTDLSLAGAREGLRGGQSSTFWSFVRILREMGSRKPPLVLLENVTGFLSSRSGQDFRAAMLALNRVGYLVDAIVLDASLFVPQSRKRLFIIGVQDYDINLNSTININDLTPDDIRPQPVVNFMVSNPDIKWLTRSIDSPLPMRGRFEDIIDDPPEDSNDWWSEDRVVYLLNQMSPRHREVAEAMIHSERISYGTVFRRMRNGKSTAELRADGLAGCLRTPKGGSARQIIFRAGRGKCSVRFLNPREAARLMGADDYNITVNTSQALFGFGDAVCVPAVEWVAINYLNPVAEEMTRLARGICL